MIEIETKLAVKGKGDFERLLTVMPQPALDRLQLNLYLDTPDGRVAATKTSLRLRIAEDRAWITLKRRLKSQRADVFVAHEAEEDTSRDDAVAWLEHRGILKQPRGREFDDLGGMFSGNELSVVAWSRTRRRAFDLGKGVILEADETLFADGFTDYEIEIERVEPDRALAVAMDIAARAGIGLEPQDRTKHARAIAHRGGLTAQAP